MEGHSSHNQTKISKIRTQKKFDALDILRVFLLIGEKEVVDRGSLAALAELGEGSVRTILEHLVSKGLVVKRKRGNALTPEGKVLFQKITAILTIPKRVRFDVFKDGFVPYGSVLENYVKERARTLYKARDHAIRMGCESAMILICTHKHIKVPYVRKWNFDELREEFNVKKGDLIILTSAQTRRTSEKGILAVARFLSDEFSAIFGMIVDEEN